MRFADVVGEALRNLRTGSSRAGVLTLIAVVASTALLIADVAVIGLLQERARSVRDHGGAIRVLISQNAVNPAACSSLGELEGVTESGAIWELAPTRILALPSAEVPVFELSPGAARMLDFPTFRPEGIYISEALAERWHARKGSRVETADGALAIDGVFGYPESDGRDPRLTNAVVVVGQRAENASECWYNAWPPSRASDQFAYGAAAASGRGATVPQVVPLNPTVGQRFDFAGEFSSRITALSFATVVILFAIVGFAGCSRRRMELAGNLHAGARRRDVVMGAVVETLAWSAVAGVATFVLVRLSTKLLLNETLMGYEVSLAASLGLAVGAAVLGAVIPVVLVAEDRLLAIFKSRG